MESNEYNRNDLFDYINLRIKAHDQIDLEQYPENQRRDVQLMAIGRIRELENMKKLLNTKNGIKESIQKYMRYFCKIETESMLVE
jgi:hypothetical protein